MERLSRVSYINKVELEACLLSRSMLSSLVSLLPTTEDDLWVREMAVSGLDLGILSELKPLIALRKLVLLREIQTSFRGLILILKKCRLLQ